MNFLSFLFGGESRRESQQRWRRLDSAIHQARYRDHNFFSDLDHCMKLVDKFGYTPLMTAARCADLTIVRYCLNVDSETTRMLVNYTGCDETPLMVAIRHCPKSQQHRKQRLTYGELVQLLLEHGAAPDWRAPKSGLTALMVAAKRGEVPLAQKLLNFGATIDLVDKRGFNAEAYARRARCQGLVQLLDGTPLHAHSDHNVRIRAGNDKRTSSNTLAELAHDENWHVRGVVAQNDNTPQATLDALAGDPVPTVRCLVASHSRTSAAALTRLADDSDREVRRQVSLNPNTPSEVRVCLTRRDGTGKKA